MDSNSEDKYQNTEHALPQDAAQYRVTYPHGRNTKEADYDKNEEFNKKRYALSRSGNNPGRVKRVVSCKRKTHHLTVARRKQLGTGRTYEAANKENEMKYMQDMQQEIFDMDPWEFPLNVSNIHKTGRSGSEQDDYCTLAEVRNTITAQTIFLFLVLLFFMNYCVTNMQIKPEPNDVFQLTGDHSIMTDVLFGRNLRLKVSLTLWQRNVGELLTYFLRIQDTGVFVDFLPLISKSIDEDSPRITIGCCVDIFPLVKKVLTTPYEEYLIVGLKWINSVLKNWWEELRASGYSGSAKPLLHDKNFQAFNQQLLELWHQEPLLKFVPGTAGDMAKVIDSFLSLLT
ncbi:KATNB1-like protein 1 isoform X1 [Siniperca chuatsi]|uniref:KATNB1-like protein 1 isoform X1 n=1 Tax=Siniperca chuatsi TaxID=119488 RepID=UPI001CE1A9A2|nr:KATNB1-like protein 1 isoform X1 [Siniperca chuatsi]